MVRSVLSHKRDMASAVEPQFDIISLLNIRDGDSQSFRDRA